MARTATLLLLRHAKAKFAPELDDHERPLAPRGERAATLMGAHLARSGSLPSLILCSTALRARQTLAGLTPELPGDRPVRFLDELYLASSRSLLETVHTEAGHETCVMIVGHNPGLAELAWHLAGSGNEAAYGRMRTKFPTAALATLEFETGLSEIGRSSGRLRDFVVARQLG
jgi:phosphohistidine phosphatase